MKWNLTDKVVYGAQHDINVTNMTHNVFASFRESFLSLTLWADSSLACWIYLFQSKVRSLYENSNKMNDVIDRNLGRKEGNGCSYLVLAFSNVGKYEIITNHRYNWRNGYESTQHDMKIRHRMQSIPDTSQVFVVKAAGRILKIMGRNESITEILDFINLSRTIIKH